MKTTLPSSYSVLSKPVLMGIGLLLGLSFSRPASAQNPCSPDKVIICHKGKNTLCVAPSAVPAHLAHGDKIGSCNPAPPPSCTVTATGGKITCAKPSITLLAATTSTGASFKWTGPNSFVSILANPAVTVAGVYTCTVSSTSCTSVSDTALVIIDKNAPTVTASGGTLTCNAPSVVLIATSSVSGSTFKWTGPNSFTSTIANPRVQLPGTYVVTVTNPANGCTASSAAVVQQNLNAPVILTIQASGSGSITCTNPSVVLTATTTSTDVSYHWTGPNNFVSDSAMPSVTQPGTYNLSLANRSSGCASTASILVTQNTTTPAQVSTTPAVLGTLTCSQPSLVLSGGSATTGVRYNWTGPNGFTSSARVTTATVPGLYTLRVTDTTNGCGSQAAVTVQQNITTPAAVTASNSEPLTCFTTDVSILGSSSTQAVSYGWSGPGGFSSNLPNTTTTVAGTYTLTVTDLLNGCTSTATTTVEQHIDVPANVAAQNSGPLTCTKSSVTLSGTSSTTGVDYNWFGPDGYFAATANATAQQPGEYLLMVTNMVNGCSSSATTTVDQDLSQCATVAKKQALKGEAEIATTGVEFNAYPNPAHNRTLISFTVPQSGKVTVTIYNSHGAQQKLLLSQQSTAGHTYQLPLDISKFSKGVYYCVMTVNGKLYSKKLVVMP